MDSYIIIVIIIGIATLGMAWMPSFTKKTGISDSVVYVLLGVIAYECLDILPSPSPLVYTGYTIHLTELVVIISLMGTGLKIDRPFSFKSWQVPFRLLTITMLLCIAAVTFSAWYFLGFDLPSALLLGAVLAPTDPVLASDVQVGPPLEDRTDDVRFSLTAEAGMNDGMAFPFTWLAILLAAASGTSFTGVLKEWFTIDLIYKILSGVIFGVLLGRLLAYVIFNFSEKNKHINLNDGFISVAASLTVFGIVELLHGYGFVAVFVAAITLRNYELDNEFHKELHSFSDQIERILVAIVLLIFGGSLVHGILDYLTWPMALLSVIFLLLIRPMSGIIALIGTKLHLKEKLGISFYGIRGIGSFYYLAFALREASFPLGKELWSMVAFIALLSVLMHGLSAARVMAKLEKKFSQIA
ncbi:cation:proton antiporter [Dyadobacter psychrotolerans]|uniref:Sodium:proton antiporter n=1 Tax=Dyadobacter psychrotolerans TaxID=2541721 RepID=A0A4R5DTB4_9BACT|nr:cation:proton antiporter [Dyadobacter psychrotolerans]TDE17649.1 sodium:proton antiporter [Dyadobacter psychrotolerans]